MGPSYLTMANGKTRTDSQQATYYKTYWRTFQMSDHLPMWIEIQTDYSGAYLDALEQAPR
jgi:hypothetical protein